MQQGIRLFQLGGQGNILDIIRERGVQPYRPDDAAVVEVVKIGDVSGLLRPVRSGFRLAAHRQGGGLDGVVSGDGQKIFLPGPGQLLLQFRPIQAAAQADPALHGSVLLFQFV